MAPLKGHHRPYMKHETDSQCAHRCSANVNASTGYIDNIDDIRRIYYPPLQGTVYLDHAGTTTYPNALIDIYAEDLKTNLFGNPHSASSSSQLSSRRIDALRVRVLRYLNADPDEYDLVFVANATAAVKLVADSFRDTEGGFWFGYHHDAHTSLVGVRELAVRGSECLSDAEFDTLLREGLRDNFHPDEIVLLAYPGQSNMTGQRYSLNWCKRMREMAKIEKCKMYSLYDAAALLSTAHLDLSDSETAPDFTVLSFYKMFGFPDIGGLIVRKASAEIFKNRKYFGGGTTDVVSVDGRPWHAKREPLHSSLEDGTLPFHDIIALDHAMSLHDVIFGGITNIASHTMYLSTRAYKAMNDLRHGNGNRLCRIYSGDPACSQQATGPVIAFNLIDSRQKWISNAEVEKLGIVKGIQFRTGGLCNPGGISRYLDLTADQMKKNYDAGLRCGGNNNNDVLDDQPTGVIRISFGASSSLEDVDAFLEFLAEFFIDHNTFPVIGKESNATSPNFIVDSISVFPIKSCGGFSIPKGTKWDILSKGFRFDREWCLVHQGTNVALSQKQFPRMTLLKPTIDLHNHRLTITYSQEENWNSNNSISIDLDEYPESECVISEPCKPFKSQNSMICGETILVHVYTSPEINLFFSNALGVPCTLARFPTDSMAQHRSVKIRRPTSLSTPSSSPERHVTPKTMGLKLSNESPILLISQSSVDMLNAQIHAKHKPLDQSINNVTTSTIAKTNTTDHISSTTQATVRADSFRANIVIAETGDTRSPYVEDTFTRLKISGSHFNVLGPCQRCQMVCVDQGTGTRNVEPFSTLAKTRRMDGRVWFGMHLCLMDDFAASISVGDVIDVEYDVGS